MKLIDMHCDTISKLFQSTKGESLAQNHLCVDFAGMKKAGTWIQYFACFVNVMKYQGENRAQAWSRAWEEAGELLNYLHREEANTLKLIRTLEDVESSGKESREEDILFALAAVEEGGVLDGRIERLETLYKKGVRLITLTWNYENCIGYPNSRKEDVMQCGLKPFGMEVVQRMNELGMIIDVSHLSEGGFWNCIRESKAPVVASHSNARALCEHPRNLTDKMLRALAEKGGVAGLNFYPLFVKANGVVTTEDIALHAKYMIQTAGEDAVAIGSDFDGFEPYITERYISHISEMERLWEACKKAGITERQLDKIRYRNVWRVMREIL